MLSPTIGKSTPKARVHEEGGTSQTTAGCDRSSFTPVLWYIVVMRTIFQRCNGIADITPFPARTTACAGAETGQTQPFAGAQFTIL